MKENLFFNCFTTLADELNSNPTQYDRCLVILMALLAELQFVILIWRPTM